MANPETPAEPGSTAASPASLAAALTEDARRAGEAGHLLPAATENLVAWAGGGFLPGWALEGLTQLVGEGAWEELNDRFFRYLEFGTGGMRGRTIGKISPAAERGEPSERGTPAHPAVGTAYLNDFNLARATAGLFRYNRDYLAARPAPFDVPRLVIAHDVRHFSRHFCELAASIWTRLGGTAFIFDGPRSTPHLSFAVRHLRASAGVVITASHNPPHDNGYKVYFDDGGQVVSPHAERIIAEVGRVALDELPDLLEIDLGRVVTLPPSVDDAYLEALGENVTDPDVLREERPKVVFTPIHGVGGIGSVPILERYGVEVVTVPEQDVMDPRFPTVASPNPENPEALALGIARAQETGAAVVLATDPDCDRVGIAVPEVDEVGDGETPGAGMRLLTGNTVGALLADYRIGRLKELGWLPGEGSTSAALIKTFVTTEMAAAVASHHGLKLIDTLTGFKWTGAKLRHYEDELVRHLRETDGLGLDYDRTDQKVRADLLLRHSTYVVFAFEESYGYLASDRVRDKDGNAAVLQVCELVAALKRRGVGVLQHLDELYLRYGYFAEAVVNIYYEGASGAAQIARILDSYRESPPAEIGGYAVTRMTDFGAEEVRDADGHVIPQQNFYLVELDNGYRYAARGSGTEPKIKFYLFAREDVPEPAALPAVKAQTTADLEALRGAVEADARQRAGGS